MATIKGVGRRPRACYWPDRFRTEPEGYPYPERRCTVAGDQTHLWWQKGVIYQIYPRSYQDSNGDGIGDLPGIAKRLDYIQQLNVDAVWLSPIYPSPMHDFGYDVADYVGIHPMFGTMEDFDRLLAEIHGRGMKLILDLVPNHTSHEHPWFIESRSSRENPKRDWYIWRDPAPEGGPPNNWQSFFGGPAWTLDAATGQYYLHQFLSQQPELNYRNPEVRYALRETMRFWLDKGVDGFRIDVIWLMIKDEELRDNPPNPDWDGKNPHDSQLHRYSADRPEVHDLIREMRQVLDGYDERMMVGEIYLPNEDLVTYYGRDLDECHLPFNFRLILTPWNARAVRRVIEEYEAALPEGAWPNWVLGNHDQHRVATRVGPDQARVAQMLLLTLRGTPTCYYGDELGMENVTIPPDRIQDPPALNQPEIAHIVGRDPERTPMQWDATPNAGFADAGVNPWLPVADDYGARNVAVQSQDSASMLTLYRRLVALRRDTPALYRGRYVYAEGAPEDCLVYRREDGEQKLLIALNFSDSPQAIAMPDAETATIVLSTHLDRSGPAGGSMLHLRPNEGVILEA